LKAKQFLFWYILNGFSPSYTFVQKIPYPENHKPQALKIKYIYKFKETKIIKLQYMSLTATTLQNTKPILFKFNSSIDHFMKINPTATTQNMDLQHFFANSHDNNCSWLRAT